MTQPQQGEPKILHHERLRGGQMWSGTIRRGHALRLTDVEGSASVAALFYNADHPLERYNMADTLKAQYTARLTQGYVLYSDMGRILMSVIEDGCGWHDTISGGMDASLGLRRYGEGTYQELRNDFHRNTRDNLLIALAKHGLGKRDVVANVNFFVKIAVDEEGRLSWVSGNSRASASVVLRAEMNVLVVLSNTPHPLDPKQTYGPGPIDLAVYAVPAPPEDDACRKKRPENERGFELTQKYFL